MTHAFKSIFVTLMLTTALSTSIGQKLIELRIDPGTGDLVKPYEPEVGYLGGVEWVIADSQIESFRIEEKAGNPRYIFTQPLPTVQGKSLHMKRNFVIGACIWKYNIIWIKTGGTERTYDPKIAVKPGVTFIGFIIGFIVIIITSMVFFRNWRKAKAKLAEKGLQNE